MDSARDCMEGDNCGIQVGRTGSEINNILLALDATLEVAHEAAHAART